MQELLDQDFRGLAPSEMTFPKDLLENEFLNLTEAEGVSDVDDLTRILDRAVRLKAFLKAEDRVDKVARFIATHFKENVEPLGYKAFIVAVDREACALYKRALDKYLPTEYTVPVYTKSAADPIERPLAADLQVDETNEKTVRKEFPKADRLPKIFIVTDKLLTGYDATILYCTSISGCATTCFSRPSRASTDPTRTIEGSRSPAVSSSTSSGCSKSSTKRSLLIRATSPG